MNMENITKNLQLTLLTIILLSTVIAVGIEIKTMFLNQITIIKQLRLVISHQTFMITQH